MAYRVLGRSACFCNPVLFINFYVKMCGQGRIKLLFFLNQKSQYQSKCLRLVMVSVSVSIFDTKDKSRSISLNFLDQFRKSQSQILIPKTKVSVSVSIF